MLSRNAVEAKHPVVTHSVCALVVDLSVQLRASSVQLRVIFLIGMLQRRFDTLARMLYNVSSEYGLEMEEMVDDSRAC
jgi:hypothetical protein